MAASQCVWSLKERCTCSWPLFAPIAFPHSQKHAGFLHGNNLVLKGKSMQCNFHRRPSLVQQASLVQTLLPDSHIKTEGEKSEVILLWRFYGMVLMSLPFCYHEKLQYAFKKGVGAVHRMRGLLCYARSHIGCNKCFLLGGLIFWNAYCDCSRGLLNEVSSRCCFIEQPWHM